MQTKYLALLAAATAAGVSAGDIQHVDVVHILETLHVAETVPGFSLNKRNVNALLARDSNEECKSSASSINRDIPTLGGSLASWAATATHADECTLLIPSSLSSAFMSYHTSLANWNIDKKDDVHKFVENCLSQDELDKILGRVAPRCSNAGTVIFTATSTTETVDMQTVLPTFTPMSIPTKVSNDASANDASAHHGINMMAAAAAACVAGFMLTA
ncbi:infection structure specific [Fusarium longipes]|uniref:Infection structure specific n=1 Tax=Fusarium longipes TaxID=694270 RepID=A0A395RST9_9HYPO|nr:infection structure specific [Fusarium longipes]